MASSCEQGGKGGELNENVRGSQQINEGLWHACAGPIVTIPPPGSVVVYFPQGHSEQVSASMGKDINSHIPSYPNLPSKLICLFQGLTLHAEPETDAVFARMTLQPVNADSKDAILASDLPLKANKPRPEFFCKTLTASDTSTHGGFSVPRRAAEKIFPPLNFSMQPPAQELQARDLHDNVWNFRHIYRGQPKRHLLTTGWSSFVSAKRLLAGDSVLFIRDRKSQLLLGIRRSNRQLNSLPSSLLSHDSMHIGILAAAAHAASNNSPFTIFYNPRASPSEFVIPLSKFNKAIYGNPVSPGMRFRMLFETEELGTKRYMGTITGISDLDPVRWKNSQWRNLQVAWDETAAGEKCSRVSTWEIEPILGPFLFLPPPPSGVRKRHRQPDDESTNIESAFKQIGPWFCEDMSFKNIGAQNDVMHGFNSGTWTQQGSPLANSNGQALAGSGSENLAATDLSRQLCMQAQMLQQANIQFNAQRATQQIQDLDRLSNLSSSRSQVGMISQPLQQLQDVTVLQKRQLVNQACPSNQVEDLFMQPQILVPTQASLQQLPLSQTFEPFLPGILQNQLYHSPLEHQQQLLNQQQVQTNMAVQIPQKHKLQLQFSEQQIQLKLLQNFPLPTLQQPLQVHEQQNLFNEASQLRNMHLLTQQSNVQQYTDKSNSPSVHYYYQPQQHQRQPKPQNQQAITTDLSGNITSEQLPNILPSVGVRGCLPASAVAHSVLTDDAPSHCTSPSTNNGPLIPQKIVSEDHDGPITLNKASHSPLRNVNAVKFCSAKENLRIGQKQENEMKPSVPGPKSENIAADDPQVYPESTAYVDYVESSSSATSNCLSQSDAQHQNGLPSSSANHSPTMFRAASSDAEFQVLQAADPGTHGFVGVDMDGQLGQVSADSLIVKNLGFKNNYTNDISSVNLVENYGKRRPQQMLPSSFISQTSGIQNVEFNSIDMSMNEGSFPNKYSGMAAPPFQRMRTYTKVYKRGAVGRSVDITRYSGYDELKRELSRMFNIGGQLDDLQRLGWKLVYVDHENDVLLVGDDPWEEFVNCLKCIKILSPQEVQQMSLEGDLGKNALPNQACSGSDGGNHGGSNVVRGLSIHSPSPA